MAEGGQVAGKPEDLVRADIDRLLAAAGWAVLPYAKANIHAEDIVKIVREKFAKANEFAPKIVCCTTKEMPERLVAAICNSDHPRNVATAGVFATGTDVTPLDRFLRLTAFAGTSRRQVLHALAAWTRPHLATRRSAAAY